MTACVLVLAGLDPSGGAGLLADAEAIRAQGLRPLCVPTALTIQTSARALAFEPVEPAFALACARVLLAEEPVRAVKVGMLGTAAMARAVGQLLEEAGLPAVLDPVLAASSGAELFRGGASAAREAYAALWSGRVLTPNAPEAAALLGWPPLEGLAAQERAARELVARGAGAALVKGGHVPPPQATGGAIALAIDVLAEEGSLVRLSGPRLSRGARGTGCRLASALAAGLSRGLPVQEAARVAKEQVLAYLGIGQA